MPSQFAESTETLEPGKVGVTVAGGAGAIAACCKANNGSPVGFGGGEARLRVGVGGKQEVGVSAFGGVGSNNPVDGALGGKLAYKIAPVPWLAVVANAGAYDFMGGGTGGISHTAVFGGDLAAILAAKLDSQGNAIYSGARGSFVIPVLDGAHGATETVTVPVGIMLATSERVRVFLEGGLLLGFSQFTDEKDPTSSGDTTTLGGFGTAAIQFILP
jgi:hypothetical protein